MSEDYRDDDLLAKPAFKELVRFLRESRSEAEDLESFERELHSRMAAAEASLLAEHIEGLDVDADFVEVEGQICRRKMKHKTTYCGLAGTFEVERTLFVPRGGGRAIVPLELQAGIVEGHWTPLAARLMARAVASTTPKEAAELFEEIGGMKPSPSSLDRVPKRLSERWEESREQFEDDLRGVEPVPQEAVAVAVSLDGVQVPMKDGDRKKKRSQECKKPQGPAGFREVGCGTVSLYDDAGERLETKRYGRMPEALKKTVKEQVRAELESTLAARPDLEVVVLSDGAEDHWTFFEELATDLELGDRFNRAVDIFHVLERVQKALNAYHGEGTPDAKATFQSCRIWLREEEDGAERVLRALRYRRTRTSGNARKTIDTQVKYIQKRVHLMRYKDLLDRNLPIGSGVVEAACKTLASERLKRSGMSWRGEGGQAILTLRSLIQSERWDMGWALLAGQYRRSVTPLSKVA